MENPRDVANDEETSSLLRKGTSYGAAASSGAPPPPTSSPPVLRSEKDASGGNLAKKEWGPREGERCVVRFPKALDECLRSFDDPIIAVCQMGQDGTATGALKCAAIGCKMFSRIATFFTAIEIGVSVPLLLYFCGADGEAAWFATLMAVTGAVTQVPKRFIWRSRPFHVNRAVSTLRNATSSFPSRAVACSAIYAYLAAYTIVYPTENALHASLLWLAIAALLVPLASFARINLGVHYPSDCVVGGLVGIVVCAVGTALSWAETQGCSSCRTAKCYAMESAGEEAISWKSLDRVAWGVVAGCAAASLAATVLAVAPPLRFWNKCAHVGGVTLGCLTFHLAFLCKEASANGLRALPPPKAELDALTRVGCLAAALFLSLLLFGVGKIMQSKRVVRFLGSFRFIASAALFAIVYTATFSALAAWRLTVV